MKYEMVVALLIDFCWTFACLSNQTLNTSSPIKTKAGNEATAVVVVRFPSCAFLGRHVPVSVIVGLNKGSGYNYV